jgi:membrane-associated phospholipid phosphatase
MLQAIQQTDAAILLFIQDDIRCSFLDPIMKFASFIGDYGLLWIALAAALLIPRKTRRGGIDMLICLAIAAALCNLVFKNLVARPRPFLTVEELDLIIKPLYSYSFPSGHACSSFASAMALTLAFRGKGAWAFIPAVLIAFSRIYVGIHYPSDVLCGAIFGVLISLFTYELSRRIIRIKHLEVHQQS